MVLLETTNINTVNQKTYLNKNLGNQALFSDEESSYLSKSSITGLKKQSGVSIYGHSLL